MDTISGPIGLSFNRILLDFTVIEASRHYERTEPFRVVGAARNCATFFLVPLAEIRIGPRGDHQHERLRPLRLSIPPSPGIMVFKADASPLATARNADAISEYLAKVGAKVAFMHANREGLPDDSEHVLSMHDQLAGHLLFRRLERTSPVSDKKGMKAMITEAYNFMPDVDPDRLPPGLLSPRWKTAKNMAAHVRALAAALDGAARTIQQSETRTTNG
jgi:hypothetical protein